MDMMLRSTNRKIGHRAGATGSMILILLVFFSINAWSQEGSRALVAQQMLYSLERYVTSPAFDPGIPVPFETIDAIFKK